MNPKLHAFTWPVILAFLPALFGGLGQNLQQIFNLTPATSSVAQVSQTKTETDPITISNLCQQSSGVDKGNTSRFFSSINKIITTHNVGNNTASAISPPNGASASEPDVKVANDNQNLYSHWNASSQKMLLRLCNQTTGKVKTTLYWSKGTSTPPCVPPNVIDANGQCVAPPTCQDAYHCKDWGVCHKVGFNYLQSRTCVKFYDCPSDNSLPPKTTQACKPPTDCTKDVWTCTAFATSTCPSSGVRTRICNNKPVSITCPSVTVPMPTSTEACVPQSLTVEITNDKPAGDIFTQAEAQKVLFRAVLRKPDGTIDSSRHKYFWSTDNTPSLQSIYGGVSNLSPGDHTVSVVVDPDTLKLTASKKITITPNKVCNLNTVQDIINSLRNNQPIQMPTEDFKGWFNKNQAEIKAGIDSMASCQAPELFSIPDYLPKEVYNQINKYTSTGLPVMIALVGQVNHQLIALSVKPGILGNFSIKVADPNLPHITTIQCRPKTLRLGGGKYLHVINCDYDGRSSTIVVDGGPLLDKISPLGVRQNPAQWLETHYTNIGNEGGVCVGWSTFNFKMALLLKECKS
ncbi:MAG: hypothetical protein AAB900_03265 [Patescibacteria group bacterium]